MIRDEAEHILRSNDNNLPSSAGRELGVADSTKIVRLHVPEVLEVQASAKKKPRDEPGAFLS
ncbi:MAG: hypothetical protein AAF230_03805 [Pseudomonadota bacterium]